MVRIIAADWEISLKAVSGIKNSSSIKNSSLNVKAKAWWTLIQHKLSPALIDNVVSQEKVTLIIRIMVSYEIDVAKWIF